MGKTNKASKIDAVNRVRTANRANIDERIKAVNRNNNIGNKNSNNKVSVNNRVISEERTDIKSRIDDNAIKVTKKPQKAKKVKGYKKTVYNENPYNKNRNIRKKRFRRRRAIITCSIIGSIVLITSVVYINTHKNKDVYNFTDYSDIERDGLDIQKSVTELQKRLEEKAKEEQVSFKINTAPIFEDGTSKGDLYIENSADNKYDIQVQIVLDDTAEEVLETEVLEPGDMITTIALDKELDAGEYDATAIFNILDRDTAEIVNTVENAITITVQE